MKNSILLLFLGIYKSNGKEESYTFENRKEPYKGTQTSDAPVKCLLDCAENDNNPINRIYCVVSKEVYATQIQIGRESHTSYEWFKNTCIGPINNKRESGRKIEICPIYYDFRVGENGTLIDEKTGDYALHIYKQLSDNLGKKEYNNEKTPIYIDYTSGFRDVSFLMTSIIRYLEFLDVELRKIIYSNLYKHQIFDIGYIYDMYQLVNGVSEFVNTGNAAQLTTLYAGTGETEIKALIDAINDFSDTLSLCALSGLERSLDVLSEAMNAFKNKTDVNGMYSQIFKTLLGTIENKMPFIKEDYADEKYLIYPELIKWCVDNGMLQQALTIYTEKMPIYYIEKYGEELCSLAEFKPDELNNADNSRKTQFFYTDLFSNIYAKYGDKSKFEKFRTDIETLSADLQKEGPAVLTVASVADKLESFYNEKKVDEYSENYINVIPNIIKEIKENYSEENAERIKGINNDLHLPNTLYKYIKNLDNKIKNMLKEYREERQNTYANKMKVLWIMNPENNKIPADKQNDIKQNVIIFEAMKYYFAVKIVRNLVNHANDEQDTKDDNIIKEMEESYNIVIATGAKDVKKILSEGIEKTTGIS